MSRLRLHLREATRYEWVDEVVSFVGEDESGWFGILPGHERFATILGFGLARFRTLDGDWEYLAVPGGVLYLRGQDLMLCARRLFRHGDYRIVVRELSEQLMAEERSLHAFKSSLQQLERQLMTRIWQLGREGVSL